MIVLDTSGALALFDDRDPLHDRVRTVVEDEQGPFLLSPFVLAELDYLVRTRVGTQAQLALLDEVASGAYDLVQLGTDQVARGRELIAGYADLRLSLTDASVVVLAEVYDTDRVLTLDERDFRAVVRADGRPFTILPADAA